MPYLVRMLQHREQLLACLSWICLDLFAHSPVIALRPSDPTMNVQDLTFMAWTRDPFDTVLEAKRLVEGAESAFCCLRPEKDLMGVAAAALLATLPLADAAAKAVAEPTDWTAREDAILIRRDAP